MDPIERHPTLELRRSSGQSKNLRRLKLAAAFLTLGGVALFAYFVYSVGIAELVAGIERFGLAGLLVILLVFFVRIVIRSWAWTLSVFEPYSLGLRDAVPAVIIGETMSSLIPLGILISGTSKAVAVRARVPLVVGLSSVATENLFYSLTTGIFLIAGGLTLASAFVLDDYSMVIIYVLLAGLALFLIFLFLMVLRQWHFASESCEWLFKRGHLRRILENGRLDVRLFENMIYGFYRQYPNRFLPICLLEAFYHILGIFEVWYVLGRLSDVAPSLLTAFLLESVSRMITIIFKLIPFVIGVDEAGAEFVSKTVALTAGIGLTLAIIRKARILFWTLIGLLIMAKRGLSFNDLSSRAR